MYLLILQKSDTSLISVPLKSLSVTRMMLRVIPRYAMFHIVFLFFCVNLSHSAMSHGFSGGVVQNDTVIPFQGKDYIINETITVQDNVTLTVEPGVTLRFNENRSMIIHGALVANGTHSYPITFRSLLEEMANVSYTTLLSGRNLRLVDGWSANAGRLEVFYGGAWGTVCDHSWNGVDSEVACKEPLGSLEEFLHETLDQEVDKSGWNMFNAEERNFRYSNALIRDMETAIAVSSNIK